MKRRWTKWLCGALAVVLLLTAMPVSALEEAPVVERTYDNSILVTVLVDEARNFAPEDFPDINCKSVWITEKSKAEQGFLYELIFVLQNSGDLEIEKTISTISQHKIVKSAQRNEKFADRQSSISLNKSIVYLETGHTADISIERVDLIEKSTQNIGITFTINPEIYNADTFEKNSFLEYGISRFWPNTEKGEKILIEKSDDLEAQKSADGKYYGLVSDPNSFVDTINGFAQLSGILCLSVVKEAVPGGEPPYENWNVNRTEVIDFNLHGGETVTGFGGDGPRVNQIATVKGLKPGVSTLVVERGGFGAHSSASCTVIVYLPGAIANPGDISRDGTVDAADALMTLQHSVGLVTMQKDDQLLADLNDDNHVDASDALIMLQISVEIIQ